MFQESGAFIGLVFEIWDFIRHSSFVIRHFLSALKNWADPLPWFRDRGWIVPLIFDTISVPRNPIW